MTGDQQAGPTVGVHVHFGMTGALPLRLADLCFTDDGLVVVEYGTITPVVGLLARSPRREADRMARTYRDGGLEAIREAGDRTIELGYDEIERIVCYDGRSIAREKIAIHVEAGPPYGYRIHAPIDLEALEAGLAAFPPTATLPVERRSTIGFRPTESLARFRSGR